MNSFELTQLAITAQVIATSPRITAGNSAVMADLEMSYRDEKGTNRRVVIKVSESMAGVIVEALTEYHAARPSRAESKEQVMTRQRSQIMWDKPGEHAMLELGSDNLIYIDTGFPGDMRINAAEATRFSNAIRRLLNTLKGGVPFKAQRDCVHCQADLYHDTHETAEAQVERGRTLTQLLRTQRNRLNGQTGA